MVKNYVDLAIKCYIETYNNEFGDKCKYLYFKKQNYTNKEGLHSNIIFGQIIYSDKNGTVYETESLLLKVIRKIRPSHCINVFTFTNEIYFYTKLLPFFIDLNNNVMQLFPKFYYSHLMLNEHDTEDGVIIFENLKAKHYVTSKCLAFLDIAHLRLMMRKIGQFHAYSYEAKRRLNCSFLTFCNSFFETHITVQNMMPGCLTGIAARGLQSLIIDSKYSHKISDIQEIVENVNEYFSRLLMDEKENQTSVLCHGDYLSCNVLFLYNDNGVPVDMKLIDLASCKLVSPVFDLASVLYLNADQGTRNKHWNELIDEYYMSLTKTFPDNHNIPTKEDILAEFRLKSFHIYFIACYFLGSLIAIDNKMKQWLEYVPDELKLVPFDLLPSELYIYINLTVGGSSATDAITNILKDMIDRGFI